MLRWFPDRFVGQLEALLDSSIGAGMPLAVLDRLGGKGIREEPGLVVKAISGLGTIETTRLAVDLWDLGRAGRRQPRTLRRVRHRRDRPARATSSATAIARGGRVPRARSKRFSAATVIGARTRWSRAAETWGTSPEIALAAIDKLRAAGSDADPHASAVRLARRPRRRRGGDPTDDAAGHARAGGPLLATAARGASRREIAKGTIIHHIAGLRQVLFAVADRLVASGQLPDRFSLFMVTVDGVPDSPCRPDVVRSAHRGTLPPLSRTEHVDPSAVVHRAHA